MQRCWLTVDKDTDLGALPAGATPGFDGDEAAARAELEALHGRLDKLQQKLYAERRRSLLLVLQAMDAGGKDGAVRNAFSGVSPQGMHVVSFKAPTPEELAHDFLRRVHCQTPAAGMIGVFVRSHYEDVVAVRVRKIVPRSVWQPRFAHIRAFERLLAEDGGTRILKVFLHIDRDEQKQRLLERATRPSKHWKFDPGDLDDRARWNEYMEAYREAMVETDAPHAPWYVIPANRKWFRDLALARLLVATLEDMDPKYPPAAFDPDTVTID